MAPIINVLLCLAVVAYCTAAGPACPCSFSDNEPVCDTRGISFMNECLAKCQGATIVSKGLCLGDRPFTGTGGFSTRSARVESDDYSAHISDGFVLAGKIATNTVGPKRPVISAEAMKELTGENRVPLDPSRVEMVQAVRLTPEGLLYVEAQPKRIDFSNLPASAYNPGSDDAASDSTDQGASTTSTRTLKQADNRYEVPNTNIDPYRAVGQIYFTGTGAGGYICSGTFISPLDVLTAGHCVYDTDTDSAFVSWNFYRAQKRNDSLNYVGGPMSEVLSKHVADFYTLYRQYKVATTGVNYYDIAVLRMKTASPNWLALQYNCPSATTSYTGETCGYPADLCTDSACATEGMWCTPNCTISVPRCSNQGMMTSENCYTYSGQSGSSLRQQASSNVRGVVSGGPAGEWWKTTFAPIDDFHYANVMSWISDALNTTLTTTTTYPPPPPNAAVSSFASVWLSLVLPLGAALALMPALWR